MILDYFCDFRKFIKINFLNLSTYMYIDKHIVFKSNLSEHNLGSLWAQSKKDNCQMHKDESRQEDVFFFTVVKVTYEFCLLKITCTCTFPLMIINRQQVYNEGKGFTKSMFDKKWYFLLGSYSPKLYPAKKGMRYLLYL